MYGQIKNNCSICSWCLFAYVVCHQSEEQLTWGPRPHPEAALLVAEDAPKCLGYGTAIHRASSWNAQVKIYCKRCLHMRSKPSASLLLSRLWNYVGTLERGNTSARTRTVPKIMTDATCLQDVIDWSETIDEPPLTCSMSRADISKFIDGQINMSSFPMHGQSIERCVQAVRWRGHVRRCMERNGEMAS